MFALVIATVLGAPHGAVATVAGDAPTVTSAAGSDTHTHTGTDPTVSRARAMCAGSFVDPRGEDATLAGNLMAGLLPLGSFHPVGLPADPTWREDPFSDAQWRFQYISLQWLDALRRAATKTGNLPMLDRWSFLLRDSLADVPLDGTAGPDAWMDMALGVRAVVISCAVTELGPLDWLMAAAERHAEALASEEFYAGRGNHAMHHNNGLLTLGHLLGRQDFVQLAVRRNESLLVRSVDDEGVTDEGALGYQSSNYQWWADTRSRLLAAGVTPSATYARIDRMPELMAYATAPDRTTEMLGDTGLSPAAFVPGTESEYAATGGRKGKKPAQLTRVYRAGYQFVRSSWEKGDLDDATYWTLRFGPPAAEQVHGHHDQGSITLSAYGSRLLWDQGLYAYDGGSMREYVRSAPAHNGITVAGAKFDEAGEAPILTQHETATHNIVTVEIRSQREVRWVRTVFYSKRGRYVIIDDRVTQLGEGRSRTAVQRFHLGADRGVQREGAAHHTVGPGANLSVIPLGEAPETDVVSGQHAPKMGWRSTTYRQVAPVPVVEARLTGRDTRFTTALVPRRPHQDVATAAVSEVLRTEKNTFVTVHAGDVTERVRLSASSAEVTPAG